MASSVNRLKWLYFLAAMRVRRFNFFSLVLFETMDQAIEGGALFRKGLGKNEAMKGG
jgi:hypothetical protein